jgi:sugar phosphate isomerase/epimerase
MRPYSVILGNLGNTCDRFLSSGYKTQVPKEEMVRQAASIPGIAGIELVGTWDVTSKNVAAVKKLLARHQLKCVSIIPDHFSRKIWGLGAFTSRDPAIRRRAVAETRDMMDAAVELGCPLINLWPGQDGYDYPFQGDFLRAWDWLVDAVRECASYRKDIRLALEYKPSEPRTHSYAGLARAADALLAAKATGCANVGVTIDVGHAFAAGENVSESAALLAREGKLFHLHFNDNYRSWDDDMIVGSVHTVEYVELLFWLRRLDYKGWYSMDQYPYREDGREAIARSVEWLLALERRIDRFGMKRLSGLVDKGLAVESTRALRELLLGKDRK